MKYKKTAAVGFWQYATVYNNEKTERQNKLNSFALFYENKIINLKLKKTIKYENNNNILLAFL
jgi:hypothetical protein